jgi:nitroreductase
MNALETLMSRRSPAKLVDPAPTPEQLDKAFAAAVRAPDHGKLRPWRFVTISGDARLRFGDVMAACMKRQQPDATPDRLAFERDKALRAPLIVAMVAKVQPEHPKIPEIEQIISAGAASQNLWLALHAQGFGCMWKTGAPAYDNEVKAALGLVPHDRIVGFLYVGTPGPATTDMPRPNAAEFVTAWEGPAA